MKKHLSQTNYIAFVIQGCVAWAMVKTINAIRGSVSLSALALRNFSATFKSVAQMEINDDFGRSIVPAEGLAAE